MKNQMPWPRIVVGLYGLILLGLAIEAGVVKGSTASLIFGGLSGLGVLTCFAIIPNKPRIGYIAASVLALILSGHFMSKYFGPEGMVYPHLVIGGISVAVFLALGAAHMLAQKQKKPA
jgi:hypothetical protein